LKGLHLTDGWVIPQFWSAVVEPSKPLAVEYPVNCILMMTNACVAEPPSGLVRLILNVETLTPSGDPFTTEKTRSLIASFVPDKTEHVRIEIAVNDRSRATLEVQGTVSVHASGVVSPLDIGDLEIDREEEEEEEEAESLVTFSRSVRTSSSSEKQSS
jgi:hypothetical protein